MSVRVDAWLLLLYIRRRTHEQKKPPKSANLHPKTGLFAWKPGYLANFLLHVYGALDNN